VRMRLLGVNVSFQPPDVQDHLPQKSLKPSPSKAFRSCAHLI
jgi:hypothetical protein